jgi:hypothetical protein
VKVDIQMFRPSEELRRLLSHDGWTLESSQELALCVSHPQVADQEQARHRLDRLGLLTSGRLRIEFRLSLAR